MKPIPALLMRPSGSPTPKDDFESSEFTFNSTGIVNEYIARKAGNGATKIFRSAIRSEAYLAASKWNLYAHRSPRATNQSPGRVARS